MQKTIILITIITSILLAELKITQAISPSFNNNNPNFYSITISNLDDIYLSDVNNHEIFKIDKDGNIINQIGGYGWDSNSFNTPADISINSGLNILIADKNNHRINRLDKNLNFISTFPNKNSLIEILYPKSIEVTNDGIIFILQENNFEILKLEGDLESYSIIGDNVDSEFQILNPVDMELTAEQNVLILERTGKILMYDKFGSPLKLLSVNIDHFIPNKIKSSKNEIYILSENGTIYKQSADSWDLIFSSKDYTITDFDVIDHSFYLLTKDGKILICQLETQE